MKYNNKTNYYNKLKHKYNNKNYFNDKLKKI